MDVVNLLLGQSRKVARNFLRKRDSGILTRLKGDLTDAFGQEQIIVKNTKPLKQQEKSLVTDYIDVPTGKI